jgi:hypothetical protein
MHLQSQFLRSISESNRVLFVYQCWYAVDSCWGVLGAQMLRATVQWRNRWLDVSMIYNLHMTHVVRCSHPFFTRFCCVSKLFCLTSQRNILTFSGTHIFHRVMSLGRLGAKEKSTPTLPWNSFVHATSKPIVRWSPLIIIIANNIITVFKEWI